MKSEKEIRERLEQVREHGTLLGNEAIAAARIDTLKWVLETEE